MTIVLPRVAAVVQASAEGATHRARGTGNQDAVAVDARDGVAVAAVADGHSDPRCVRARRGADLAAAAALGTRHGAAGLGPDVVDRWRRSVDEDLLRDPGEHGLARLAYGTTVLACRCDDRGVALLQIGDGDVVVVDAEGAASRPLRRPEPALPAGGTHSLADDDVLDVLVERLLPAVPAPRLVLLSSDGIDNAYPTEDALLRAAEDIAALATADGAERLQQEVEQWVARAADASGDDASAVVVLLTGAGPS